MVHIDIEYPFEYRERAWRIRIHELAIPKGITTKIGFDDKITQADSFIYSSILWLDWHNIIDRPKEARVLIMVHENPNATIGENIQKVRDMAAALQAYNSLMVNTPDILSLEDAETLLRSHSLPRLQTAVLDTGHQVWRKRFTNMEFPTSPEPPHPFLAPWDKLVGTSLHVY